MGRSKWRYNKSTIEDIIFLNSQKGFAVTGYPAQVLTTEDGGLSWVSLNSFDQKWLNAIHFFDELHGIAVGSDGFELRTMDGGSTWEEVKTGVGYDFKSVYFTNSLKGYAACNNGGGIGAIYKTVDAGNSWSMVLQSDDFYDVAGHGNNLIFTGNRGTLFAISDSFFPTVPGPISGPVTVPVSASTYYTVPQSINSYYSWETDGSNSMDNDGNKSVISWNEQGSHTLKVTPYNSCGEGKPRMLTVNVEEKPEPVILGADTVMGNRTEAYYAQSEVGSRLSWYLNGANKYQIDNGTVNVDWAEDIKSGSIELIETKASSGARGKTTLDVYILKGEVISSTDIKELFPAYTLYPNPTSDYITVELNDPQGSTFQIRIMDVWGTTRKVKKFNRNDNLKIGVEDLPSGLYLVELSCDKFKKVTRIIKK